MRFLLLLLSCFGGKTMTEAIDWCTLDCKGDKNTLCRYKPQKNSGSCSNIVSATTPTIRKEILHKHNEYRNKMANGEIVQNGVTWPKGSDMRMMTWDNNLEILALRWAQQCSDSPAHDTCRRTPEFDYNGQNKGFAGSTSDFPSPYGSFDGWVGEIKDANPSLVDQLVRNTGPGVVLHFTQVIWAGSYKLGCAAIHADKGGYKSTIIVCNYGPGGNIIGSKIYTRGDPCKACPAGTSCKTDSAYPQLCALPTDPSAPADIPDPPNSGQPSQLGMNPKHSKIPISPFSIISILLEIKIAN